MTKKRRSKKIKTKILANKKLLKKYPWVASDFHPWTLKRWKLKGNKRYMWTWWDDMPTGWKIAFGDFLLEDLNKAIKKMPNPKHFYISQIKEKYGERRLYCSGSDEIDDIIDAYSEISRNICLHCGKPDVGYTTGGWIMPICKKCWDRAKIHGKYEKSVCDPENWKMANQYKYSTFENGEKKTVIVDISDYAEKVRRRYDHLEQRRNKHRTH